MQLLSGHEGGWLGTNQFRMTPVDAPYEAPARLELSTAAAGRLVVMRYSWHHPEDGAQDGLLTVGPADDDAALVALWGDSWHQSPDARVLAGAATPGVLQVGYAYSGDWAWAIVIDATDPDALVLRMDNVVPDSAASEGITPGPYWTMSAALRRAG